MEKSQGKDDVVRLAASVGAQVALDKIEKERAIARKEHSSRKLYNIKLLLRNYPIFRLHAENAVYDYEQTEESALDILNLMWERKRSEEVVVESIKKSAARTIIIVNHINAMIGLYETWISKYGKEDDRRRFRVVQALYLADEPISVGEVADLENIGARQVYKDVDSACEKLSALIFGIDSVEMK